MSRQIIDYKAMTGSQIRAFVEHCNEMRAKAKTKNEDDVWKRRAQKARRLLPAQQCKRDGCTNMCTIGNVYCSPRCAGLSAGGPVVSRFKKTAPTRPQLSKDGEERIGVVLTGCVDSLFQEPTWQSPQHVPCL